MNFIKLLSNAHRDVCNAQERGLLNWDDYSLISDKLLEAMKLWNDNFNYDLESEQDVNNAVINNNIINNVSRETIKKRKGGKK